MRAERWAAIGAVLLLGACAGLAEQMREYTYPRDFEYLSRGEIEGAMGRLASHVGRLDALVGGPVPPDAARRREVVELLQAMEEIARGLGTGAARSNHPQLDEGIDGFRSRLAAARRSAERDPPNYYLAGSVSGACRYCHH